MLACEPLAIATAPRHALAGRQSVALAALAGETFIDLQNEWGTRHLIDESFGAIGVERRIAFEVNDVTMLLDLVALGLGIALVPQAVLAARRRQQERAPVGYAELVEPEPCWELAVAFAAHGDGEAAPTSAAARAFLALMPETDWPEAD
jgi:DNA-binding transcriptional LysR family regulator